MARITIDYTPALRQTAGIGRYTRGLVQAVAEIDREHAYTLFCAGDRPDQWEWPSNFRLRHSPVPSRWLTAVWHRAHVPLPAELMTGKCDLFHSPDFSLPPLMSARGVVTVHDLSFLRLPQCADPGLRAYLEDAVPRAVRRAHRVLADSTNTRDDLVELIGVPFERVSVVPGGVEPRFRRITDERILTATRSRYKLPECFILSVGTLEPRKNYIRLISAYAALRRQELDLPQHLVIAGKPGWLYEEIFQQVQKEHVEDYVRFLGFVEDADLPAIYSQADLMAFPSLYEGFGLPPLEAMACGVPVIASHNSSLPEALGEAAIYVDAGSTEELTSAMAHVLEDPKLGDRLAILGRQQAGRYTWQAAANRLLDAYRLALA